MKSYHDFVSTKATLDINHGFDVDIAKLNSNLFPFQKAIVKWALRKGRSAIFADTGLGKTPMQLEWSRNVCKETDGSVLIVAPLCVSHQTVKEAAKFGIGHVNYCRDHDGVASGVNITNYEMLEHFDLSQFAGVVLDESSILKHTDGKMRTAIINACSEVPYRLSCTATPSPNDFMELGNQCEFLGVMTTEEMLAMYFTHDGGSTSKWRLKGHGASKFWEFMASWSVCIRKPSDIGFSDDGYNLPTLKIEERVVYSEVAPGQLFANIEAGLQGRNKAKRESINDRVDMCASIVNGNDDTYLVWCHLNSESDMLGAVIKDGEAVKGSDSIKNKERILDSFSDGDLRVLITKPSIAGFGMNWQHCNKMVFVGINDSFEQFYQAVRRCYRFGQEKEVTVTVIRSEAEGPVLENIKRKERQHQTMSEEMVKHMRSYMERELGSTSRMTTGYNPEVDINLPSFV